jgi:hypothetical protein
MGEAERFRALESTMVSTDSERCERVAKGVLGLVGGRMELGGGISFIYAASSLGAR